MEEFTDEYYEHFINKEQYELIQPLKKNNSRFFSLEGIDDLLDNYEFLSSNQHREDLFLELFIATKGMLNQSMTSLEAYAWYLDFFRIGNVKKSKKPGLTFSALHSVKIRPLQTTTTEYYVVEHCLLEDVLGKTIEAVLPISAMLVDEDTAGVYEASKKQNGLQTTINTYVRALPLSFSNMYAMPREAEPLVVIYTLGRDVSGGEGETLTPAQPVLDGFE